MENPSLDTIIRKNALISGLILGGALLVLGIFTFYFITSMTTSIWMISFGPLVLSIILPLVLAVIISIDLRKKSGGYWTFKQATTAMFIMFLVCYAVQSIGRDAIFGTLIEPQMVEKTKTAVVNATSAMMEKSGADQAKIDSKMAEIEKQFDAQNNVTIGKRVQGIGINVMLIFVVALIFGAIFKKDPPLFNVIDEEEPAV